MVYNSRKHELENITCKTAESGEVFFIFEGKLMKMDCENDLIEWIEKEIEKENEENKIRNTFFEFEDGTTKYKYNILSHDSIMRAINNVKDIKRKVQLVQDYYNLKKQTLGEVKE